MRRTKLAIVVAALPIVSGFSTLSRAEDTPTSIYSDSRYSQRSPQHQSVYEKVQIDQPLDRQGNPTQKDFDQAKQKFDDAVSALNKAKEDAVSRLRGDPQIAPLEQSLAEAKNKYDCEIDDALSTMSYFDDYQELIATADKAAQQLDFI